MISEEVKRRRRVFILTSYLRRYVRDRKLENYLGISLVKITNRLPYRSCGFFENIRKRKLP